jgi:hypothetical protein
MKASYPLGIALVMMATYAHANNETRQAPLLSEESYRSQMEEVIVTGQVPEWRKAEMEQELWNRDKFSLAEEQNPARIEWFPLYAKEDRENYQGVRDRKSEKPEFKIFEWKF